VTSAQRDKGNRAEREVATLLAALTGWPVRRRLQEGRADDCGDLEGLPDCCAQVKNYVDPARAMREALADLPDQKERSGARYGVAFIRRPGGRFVAAMTVEDFVALLREATVPVELDGTA
jgi:ribosomal protein L19E